jgi:hypothetical protein
LAAIRPDRRLGVRYSQSALPRGWAALAEAIEGGPLDAPIADAKLHQMIRGDFAPQFPLEWALKDVDLAIAAAGGTLPLLPRYLVNGTLP